MVSYICLMKRVKEVINIQVCEVSLVVAGILWHSLASLVPLKVQELSPPVTIADETKRNTARLNVDTFLEWVSGLEEELRDYAHQIVLSFGMSKELETPENVKKAFTSISNKTVRAGFSGLNRERTIQFVLNVKFNLTDVLQKYEFAVQELPDTEKEKFEQALIQLLQRVMTIQEMKGEEIHYIELKPELVSMNQGVFTITDSQVSHFLEELLLEESWKEEVIIFAWVTQETFGFSRAIHLLAGVPSDQDSQREYARRFLQNFNSLTIKYQLDLAIKTLSAEEQEGYLYGYDRLCEVVNKVIPETKNSKSVEDRDPVITDNRSEPVGDDHQLRRYITQGQLVEFKNGVADSERGSAYLKPLAIIYACTLYMDDPEQFLWAISSPDKIFPNQKQFEKFVRQFDASQMGEKLEETLSFLPFEEKEEYRQVWNRLRERTEGILKRTTQISWEAEQLSLIQNESKAIGKILANLQVAHEKGFLAPDEVIALQSFFLQYKNLAEAMESAPYSAALATQVTSLSEQVEKLRALVSGRRNALEDLRDRLKAMTKMLTPELETVLKSLLLRYQQLPPEIREEQKRKGSLNIFSQFALDALFEDARQFHDLTITKLSVSSIAEGTLSKKTLDWLREQLDPILARLSGHRVVWVFSIGGYQKQQVERVLLNLKTLDRSGYLSTEESRVYLEYEHQLSTLGIGQYGITSSDSPEQFLNLIDDLLRNAQALKERVTVSLASKRAQVDSFRETSLMPALREAERPVAELDLGTETIPVIRLNAAKSLASSPTLSMEYAESSLKSLQGLIADLKIMVEEKEQLEKRRALMDPIEKEIAAIKQELTSISRFIEEMPAEGVALLTRRMNVLRQIEDRAKNTELSAEELTALLSEVRNLHDSLQRSLVQGKFEPSGNPLESEVRGFNKRLNNLKEAVATSERLGTPDFNSQLRNVTTLIENKTRTPLQRRHLTESDLVDIRKRLMKLEQMEITFRGKQSASKDPLLQAI